MCLVFGFDEMSYEDVVGCADRVGFVVCICFATAIPSSVFAKSVLYLLWCACGAGPGLDGCGCWYVCCFYGVRFASAFCIIRKIIILQHFIISVFSISNRWGVASRC